jgi:hypothetical protein
MKPAMAANDSITLCKDQWIDVYAGTGGGRLIVDHRLNALLMGVRGAVTMFALRFGDRRVVVYYSRAGRACRAAMAFVMARKSGAVCLTNWRLEPGLAFPSEGETATSFIGSF